MEQPDKHTMNRICLLAMLLLLAVPTPALAQAPAAASRGALLYDTHCVACHDKQVHWRDSRLATDWTSLKVEVRRWAANIGLRWPDATVDEVVRYLNSTIYRFPDQAKKQTV
ncbi:MAG: cytochrome C [Betaproteobacteria bacterium]